MPSSSGSSKSTAQQPVTPSATSYTSLRRSLTQGTTSSTVSSSSSSRHHHLHRHLGSGSSARQQARLGISTDYTDLHLHSACTSGNIGLVRYALQQGQPVNSVLNGVLPLHAAASSGSEAVVRELIEYGADVNAPRLSRRYSNNRIQSTGLAAGTTGSTALHFAAANGHAGIVSLLLEFGADPSAEEKYGLTPEMIATQRGHFEAASLLRQAQIEQADRAAASSASGSSAVKSLAKKRLHPQRSFDALAVKLQQHASQPHLPSSLHMTAVGNSSTSLNTQAALAGSSVIRRLSVPSHVKDAHSARRPSLPSVFEKAAHPSATLKQALGMTSSSSSRKNKDAKLLGAGGLGSASQTSLGSTLIGRNRSNSVIEDDEHDLADTDEQLATLLSQQQLSSSWVQRDDSVRPSTSSSTTSSVDRTTSTYGDAAGSAARAQGGTARADKFYRPRHSSQLSGKTSIGSSAPMSPQVFVEDDETGSEIPDVPSRSNSLRATSSAYDYVGRDAGESSAPSTLNYLSNSEMRSTPNPVDSSDRASTTSRSTFDAGKRGVDAAPRLGAVAGGAGSAEESNSLNQKFAAEHNEPGSSRSKAAGNVVETVKRVETRQGRSDSVGTDGRFSSAASSYSGPGTLSTYAPSESTNATSIHPSTQASYNHTNLAKSPLTPLYETGGAYAPSSSVTGITTSAQARSRVKKAERDLLNYDPSDTSGGSSRPTLTQKLAAYGQTLALERKLVAAEEKRQKPRSSSPGSVRQHAPFKYETISTSSIKPNGSVTNGVVTSQPLDATPPLKSTAPQWRAIPATDRLGPPHTNHHHRHVSGGSHDDKSTTAKDGRSKQIESSNSSSAFREPSTTSMQGDRATKCPSSNANEPVVFGLNPDAPKGPVSFVQAHKPVEPAAFTSAAGGPLGGTAGGSSSSTHSADKPFKNGSRKSHSNKGTSSVTSAKEQVELDTIEQIRMEQAVPKAQITIQHGSNKSRSGTTTGGSSKKTTSGFRKIFGR
ncbi:hypothetical protein OIO90_004938 [Microbotryomycetes sp. JL221]|nr:hypothetical protein OIO90_004938 [Microbotryomycetes sp. JL221]